MAGIKYLLMMIPIFLWIEGMAFFFFPLSILRFMGQMAGGFHGMDPESQRLMMEEPDAFRAKRPEIIRMLRLMGLFSLIFGCIVLLLISEMF